jgi:molybdate transport system permease protein
MKIDLSPLWLTLRISLITTLILLFLCIPLAFWILRRRPSLRYPMQTLVNLPLVLPPTVLGFYLLLLFSPERFPGFYLKEFFHLTLAFTQTGLILGSVVFSLPFMINPIISGLESLPRVLSEEATVAGASPWQILFHVLLPNIKPALIAATVLTFSHTIGEFGVALMIGGKIPGKTVLASMAVYDEVESLHYHAAHLYSGILCFISFVALLIFYLIHKKASRPY